MKGVTVDFGRIDNMDWSARVSAASDQSNWAYDFGFFHFSTVLVKRNPVDGVALLAGMLRAMERRHAVGQGRLDFPWHPIIAAIRILSLTAAANRARKSGIAACDPGMLTIAWHVSRCVAVVRRTAERHVGYNHALFGLVALAVGDVAVHNGRRATTYAKEALSCLAAQLLPDGLQAERTATYHIHVLLLARSLAALRVLDANDSAQLDQMIAAMTRALDVLTHPDGEIALFNDAAMADSVPPSAIGWHPDSSPRKVTLPVAGYTKIHTEWATAIFDTGPLGPDDVIGHAHGDFLSLEVSVAGHRFITDPGVFSYTAGDLRQHTRSAASHNGPTYVGLEPAEFFGAWRVGRRGAAHSMGDELLPRLAEFEVAGWCDGYDRAGGRVARYLGLGGREGILIGDAWRRCAGREPAVRLLVPIEWRIEAFSPRECIFMHRSGERILIETSDFDFAEPASSEWRPKGAMSSFGATELKLSCAAADSGDAHVNLIRIRSAIPGRSLAPLTSKKSAIISLVERVL